MKKAITLLLSLLMVISLAACSGQTESVGQIAESEQQTEQTSSSTPQTETDTPSSSEPSDASASTAAFDNSWASNEFEKQLPEIPFENWSIDTTYYDKSAYAIIAEDVLFTDVAEYGELLVTCAFTEDPQIHDHSLEYRISAENTAGYSLFYTFEAYNSFDDPIVGRLSLVVEPPR